jgi:hypothetical protein
MLNLLTLLQINYTFFMHSIIMQNKLFCDSRQFLEEKVHFLLFTKNILRPIFLGLFLTVRPVAEYLGTTLGILPYSSLCHHHGTPPVIRIWYKIMPNQTKQLGFSTLFWKPGICVSKFAYLVFKSFLLQ